LPRRLENDVRNSATAKRRQERLRIDFSLALIVAASSTANSTDNLLPNQKLSFDIYKELIEIDTTTATGDTARSADAMAARLREAGFPEADVHVFSPAPKKGNLVARLRGTGRAPPYPAACSHRCCARKPGGLVVRSI
jgi:hypothetical protein